MSIKNNITSIILDDEFKKFAIKLAIQVQDPHDLYYLTKQSRYDKFHEQLSMYFLSNYGKKPSQTDNLAFMLILTYPPKMIQAFNSITDLNLLFGEQTKIRELESDFETSGFAIIEQDAKGNTTCICNEPLTNVYHFKNKYSGLRFNIGCVCNERHVLINKDDPTYISTGKQIKKYKEHQKEKLEGLVEGHYENERKMKKKKKDDDKIKKQQEDEKKQQERALTKELKSLNKTNPGAWSCKKCCFCERDSICKTKDTIGICSKCYNDVQKQTKREINNLVRQNIKSQTCVNCDKDYINKRKSNPDLCCECSRKWKTSNCQNSSCRQLFLNKICENDKYCPDCDDNMIKCLDCKCDIFKNSSNNVKCYNCLHKKLTKVCNSCDNEFEVCQKDNLKKTCLDCLKTSNERAKCITCNESFFRNKTDQWKDTCLDCLKASREKVKCITCDESFFRNNDDGWRTKCKECYVKSVSKYKKN